MASTLPLTTEEYPVIRYKINVYTRTYGTRVVRPKLHTTLVFENQPLPICEEANISVPEEARDTMIKYGPYWSTKVTLPEDVSELLVRVAADYPKESSGRTKLEVSVYDNHGNLILHDFTPIAIDYMNSNHEVVSKEILA